MPNNWNTGLLLTHIGRVKRTVAAALLPVLKEEMQHLQLPEVIRRPRETEVRATCDACMTSIFSSSWMCRTCGREACFDCFAHIKDAAGSEEPPDSRSMTPPQRERHHRSPFFLPCTKRNKHQPKDFSPATRFCGTELAQAIEDMEALLGSSGAEPSSSSEDRMHDTVSKSSPTAASLSSGSAPDNSPTTALPPSNPEPAHLPAVLPGPSSSSSPESSAVGCAPSEGAIPSHDTATFSHVELTEEVFRQVWSRGDPLMVTGVLEKFHVQWTPEYFRSNYGQQKCTIVECQSELIKEVTVERFFSGFGNYEDRKESNWKLKDWPPSADFKNTFPELYDEFVRVTPVPNYVRRDGVLNIASHFPSNAVVPDLGPKMYNAQASFESEGSQGSTRLHLDMADAVNIMTYASTRADGSPGCAAWDIFKAGDSAKLREFLHKKFADLYQGDPIHAQKFYLDSALLKELYRDYGVVSHRIYQKPGEVVFIPAGCAHQVCNLADCIKVACDFVSPENIERCSVLTREFREQNQLKAWKEDVLQLRNMMWFAWLSCVAQEKRLREATEGGNDNTTSTSGAPSTEPAPTSDAAPSAAPFETPPVQGSESPSAPAAPVAAPSAPTATTDEAASTFKFVLWQPSTQAESDSSVSTTLPPPLPVASTSTAQPSNEVTFAPATLHAPLPPLTGAHSESLANSSQAPPPWRVPGAMSSAISLFGVPTSTPIAGFSAPHAVAEDTILDEGAMMGPSPSESSATWSGEEPMAVDSASVLPNGTVEALVGLKRAFPETDLDPGLPAKRYKTADSAEAVAEPVVAAA
ncbi:hypothetical protein V8D89_009103 [Ganoderma adspersum]